MNKYLNLKNTKALLGGIVLLIFVVSLASYIAIQRYSKYVAVTDKNSDINVAIVFGGGISNKEPLPLLKDRLDSAKNLLDNKVIDKILLSGDNRFLNYNEPNVMLKYLVDNGVDVNKLQRDFAGRSTYETCERANKVFGLSSAILISERTHLPRAIYLCRYFGIEAYGFASDGGASSGLQIGQRWREVLASNKAIFNTYIIGENTVLGDPIDL